MTEARKPPMQTVEITPDMHAAALAFEKDPRREMTAMLLEAAEMARHEESPSKAAKALCRVVRALIKLYGADALRGDAAAPSTGRGLA